MQVTAEFCDDVQGAIHRILAFLPVKDLAAIARLAALIALPDKTHTHTHNTRKHTFKAAQGAPGLGRWLYTLPTAPFTKVANGPFQWGLQAGHLRGKQLPGARQPCKAPLDHLGRHVAWRSRRAMEIRHNRLRDFRVECTRSTGAVAASEQAMPLPIVSQQHVKHVLFILPVSEANGSDIWLGSPAWNMKHFLSSMAAQDHVRSFFNRILKRRVQRLEGPHLSHGVAWMIASLEPFAPIFCILLVMHFRMFQECCPLITAQ